MYTIFIDVHFLILNCLQYLRIKLIYIYMALMCRCQSAMNIMLLQLLY